VSTQCFLFDYTWHYQQTFLEVKNLGLLDSTHQVLLVHE
jgi:hypothetical protein